MSTLWRFKMPVEIYFGIGEIKQLKNLIAKRKCSNVALITDKGIIALDFLQSIKEQINPCVVFSEVNPNPTVENVNSLTRVLRENQVDIVVVVGGGSVMDCAKSACCLVKTNQNDIRLFHTGGHSFQSGKIPLIAVPTTAGTGSEVTPIAVLDDNEKNFKGPIATDLFYPDFAVLDPSLTFSLPKHITASTGLDVLAHAMEGYWSKNNQPICNTLAMEAGRLVFENLSKVFNNPEDENARSSMSYAALLAGIAFQLPKNAMVHACSFPLSNRFHMAHGTACAFTLDYALKLNAPVMNGRMEHFAKYCGFDSIERMSFAIHMLKKDGGLPCTFQEAGIEVDDIDALIEESFHPLMNNNPLKITKAHLREMYTNLLV